MTKRFWKTAATLVDVLAPLVNAMRTLEADDAFISIVVPVLHKAKDDVLTAAGKCKVPAEWTSALEDIMDVYVTKYITPAQLAAWFLDPTQKMTVEQARDFGEKASEFLEGYVDDGDVEAVRHEFQRYRTLRRALFGDGQEVKAPAPEQGVTASETKLTLLLGGKSVQQAWRYEDVLHVFPLLSTVASVLLGIRASSASVERYFSVVRIVHTSLRNRLSPGACRY